MARGPQGRDRDDRERGQDGAQLAPQHPLEGEARHSTPISSIEARISGALAPTSGSIRFKDQEIGNLTPDAVCHRGVARTFQIPRPFRKLTILENVAVAAHCGVEERNTEAEAVRRAQEVLALVGLPGDPAASTSLLGAGG